MATGTSQKAPSSHATADARLEDAEEEDEEEEEEEEEKDEDKKAGPGFKACCERSSV